MVELGSDVSHIKKNGWRQGSFLTLSNQLADKNGFLLKPNSQFILISHDCDIVREMEKEPFLDLLPTAPIEKINNSLTKGKNPRVLHLDINGNYIECMAYEKFFVSKTNFIDLKPSQSMLVDGRNLDILIYWLNNRYSRVAYPDEFNRRFKENKANEKLAKIMDKFGESIKGIYVKLSTFKEIELLEESYKLVLLFLVDRKHYENPADIILVDNCFEKVIDLINDIQDIDVLELESKVRTTDDITLEEFQEYFKWDLDYLSYSDYHTGEILPGTNSI